MKVDKATSYIYSLAVGADDTDVGNCLWAKYDLNCTTKELKIESNIGNYQHAWDTKEDFLKLVAKMQEEYLKDLFGKKDIFNIKKSKENIINSMNEVELGIDSEQQLESIKDKIMAIDDMLSEAAFKKAVEQIIPNMDWNLIKIIYDYPVPVEVLINIFLKYVQPDIKETVKEE